MRKGQVVPSYKVFQSTETILLLSKHYASHLRGSWFTLLHRENIDKHETQPVSSRYVNTTPYGSEHVRMTTVICIWEGKFNSIQFTENRTLILCAFSHPTRKRKFSKSGKTQLQHACSCNLSKEQINDFIHLFDLVFIKRCTWHELL